MIRHFLNPPNWFTSASMFCGLYSIILSTGVGEDQNLFRAAVMILFAGVFDTFDGTVARLTGTSSEFGVQLDSLADIVSFGIAPAVLLYCWGIQDLGMLGLGAAFFFMLCGTFRLARFNLETTGSKELFSRGLTITMGGGTVASVVMTHAALGFDPIRNPWNVWLMAVAIALLMVSSVPYRSIKTLRLSRGWVMSIMLIVAFALVLSLRFKWSVGYLVLFSVYAASGPIELLIRRGKVLEEAGLRPEDVVLTAEDLAELNLQELAPDEPAAELEEAPVDVRHH